MSLIKVAIKDRIKKLMLGFSISQEYVCVNSADLENANRIYMTGSDDHFYEVTSSHLFLGYKPLIIGITVSKGGEIERWLGENLRICLSFGCMDFNADVRWRGFPSDRRSVARLILSKIKQASFERSTVFFFTGLFGEHRFISDFHQRINRFIEKYFHKRGNANIDLDKNLYDQVRIAYSVPRRISIITLSDGTHMNMFPTDLHGPVDSTLYIGSLRHGGKANEQVERQRNIVLSDVPIDWCRRSYLLGKNHMAEMHRFDSFPISEQRSERLSIPVPQNAIGYYELVQGESFDIGVHRIHFYEIHSSTHAIDSKPLTHIHRYYAQWLIDNNLSVAFFLR